MRLIIYVKTFNEKLSKILVDKPLNCNLGVFKDGKLEKVFKGTTDELNNVLFYTYKNHKSVLLILNKCENVHFFLKFNTLPHFNQDFFPKIKIVVMYFSCGNVSKKCVDYTKKVCQYHRPH